MAELQQGNAPAELDSISSHDLLQHFYMPVRWKYSESSSAMVISFDEVVLVFHSTVLPRYG